MAEATERKWTKGQSAAIDTHGRTLLVSAAAGSGKTATLTERIIRSLTDKENPADISKMLIVTFTRAAANELKERIFSALGNALAEDPTSRHLNEQLIKLGSANICTIDAFYLDIIRQNFSTLGLSASCRIADNSELVILKKEAMDETIDHFYDNNPDFPSFAECFIGTKSINRLSEPMLKLYDDIASRIEGVEFLKIKEAELRKYAEEKTDFFDTVYGSVIKNELCGFMEYCAVFFNNAYEYSANEPEIFGKRALTYDSDRAFIDEVRFALMDESTAYCDIRSLLLSYSPAKLGSVKGENETPDSIYYKNERANIKDKLQDLNVRIFSRDEELLREEMLATADRLAMLYSLLSDFSHRITEEKSRRNIMDFNDIRQYTYRLLIKEDGSASDIAMQYKEQFTDIYIDEYQDVDSVQDAIFRAISKDNRFMVGDIKQSIYGFRGAEPDVFADYRKRFFSYDANGGKPIPDGSGDTTIFMSENFRCDENIIEFTNLVCSRIFEACRDSIGYTRDDDLRFSKPKPSPDYVSPAVEVSVILTDVDDEEETEEKKKKDDTTPTTDELEADFIAEKIASLVGKERNANGKLIVPGDIAIIYRSNKMVSVLSDALRKRGILCSEGGGNEYFENPDVLLTLSLLNTVDNPHRDIHLAATLCSPFFEFTMDELIEIRLNAPASYSLYDALLERSKGEDGLAQKCLGFDRILEGLRRSSVSLSVDRFLRTLFEAPFFVASGLLSDRNDFGEGGNLLRLYEYARTFEAGSFKGLYNFIEFINTLIENDKKLEVAPKDKCPERVNLSTMHHSKGLEFPICFICGTGKKKNISELSKSLLFEYPLGAAMKLSDSTGFSQTNTPLREAIVMHKSLRENEEEMRILYVAMTRARERLYITATSRHEAEELLLNAQMKNLHSCPYLLKHCSSFLDWILLPFTDDTVNTDCCRLEFIRAQEQSEQNDNASATVRDEKEPSADTELLKKMQEKFAFNYAYSSLPRIPAKLSVSRLSPDILNEPDGSFDLFDTDEKTKVPDFFITDKPSHASSAERGTATHLFLQFCDFRRASKYGVTEEIARLTEMKFIPENIAELIFVDELERFMQGEFVKRICSAERVIREQRFNLLLPAEAFSENEKFAELLKDEFLAVQGVIDLILIDKSGNIELYDYKTDRLTKEELANDALALKRMNDIHGLQLSYYAHAVSELFGKPCSKICVYSTHAAKLYDISVIPLRIQNEALQK